VLSFFSQVKEAFSLDPLGSLRTLGVTTKDGGKGEWIQSVCPLCSDTNGSAGFSRNGHLKCHQCGRKQDLFTWTAELWTCSAWESCQKLAAQFSVNVDVKRPGGAAPPRYLTKEILRAATMDLWTADDAKPFRDFLANRKLDDAQLLERFGVGFAKGNLIFAQFDYFNGGKLRPCYRHYVPLGKKWFWCGSGAKPGFWPYFQVPEDGIIWILEGEWDVMTAWMRLRLQDLGIYCFTWTSTGPIPGHLVPEEWRKKIIHFLYDNDTWQGADVDPRAPSDKKLKEQELRFKKLQTHASGFLQNKCKVFLRNIPIDPLENYGADLRDWVDAGNTDIELIPAIPFKDVSEKDPDPIAVDLSEVSKNARKRVKFHGMVETILAQDRTMPTCTYIDCEMGSSPACKKCLVPALYPNRLIFWKEKPDELANAMVAKSFDNSVKTSLLGVPRNCPRIVLQHEEYDDASIWTAVKDDEASQGKLITIVSKDTPTLSGDVEVDGMVHHQHDKNTVMVMAKNLRQLDKAKIDLTPYVTDLHKLCPWDSNDIEAIDSYLWKRCADLAFNVTKIHGRPEVHLAHDLLMHSPIGWIYNGMKQRGWIDCGVVGDTRTGKTEVFSKLFHWHGVGKIWAAMSGVTLAGLTMGAVQSPKGYVLKPGLFPRSHKKVLVLDEFHVFDGSKQHPIMFLQSARDHGHCDSIKISGSRSLPSEVRFCTISNWPKNRGPGRFPCQQFLSLYQKPEALSRTDFMLVVDGDPGGPDPAEAQWTKELVRALIFRAWAMDPSLVEVDPDAIELAREFIEECKGVYSERIPLFTSEATFYSVIRIANAASCICFSHQPDNFYAARVRSAHVQFACDWLRLTWELSCYDKFSENEVRRNQILNPYEAEYQLTTKLRVFKPEEATGVFESFLQNFREGDLPALTGFENYDCIKWFAQLKRMNMFSKDETGDSFYTAYMPTTAGELILRNLIEIAEHHPKVYAERLAVIHTWIENGKPGTPNVQPLNLPLSFIIDDKVRQPSSESNETA